MLPQRCHNYCDAFCNDTGPVAACSRANSLGIQHKLNVNSRLLKITCNTDHLSWATNYSSPTDGHIKPTLLH